MTRECLPAAVNGNILTDERIRGEGELPSLMTLHVKNPQRKRKYQGIREK